jgi:hypothetical protein
MSQPVIVSDTHERSDEPVRLIAGISRVMHTPEVKRGHLSSTGKTISVDLRGTTRRLDAATIFGGEMETRRSRTFRLYTVDRYISSCSSNHAPGPQAGTNRVPDAGDVPMPTHVPEGELPAVIYGGELPSGPRDRFVLRFDEDGFFAEVWREEKKICVVCAKHCGTRYHGKTRFDTAEMAEQAAKAYVEEVSVGRLATFN